MSDTTHELVDHFFRHESARLLSILTRHLGLQNIDLAEDVVQAALAEALESWKLRGVPKNPSAWVFQVARNKARDVLRHRKVVDQYQESKRDEGERTSQIEPIYFDGEVGDSQLRMIFACSMPELDERTHIALTLRCLCGFSNSEVANALLMTPATIEKRIYRAKQHFRSGRVPLDIPTGSDLVTRLKSVHAVLYLLFNEGYNSSHPDALIRRELCGEAIRLVKQLVDHAYCASPTSHALLALMLLQAARFDARLDREGCILLLKDQDRSKWNRELIGLGLKHLSRSAQGDQPSSYHCEAGIAAEHCIAESFAKTNWTRILALYDLLIAIHDSPIYALNRAIVIGQLDGPQAGIDAIGSIRAVESLKRYHYLDAALAEMHLRAGNHETARRLFVQAAEKTPSLTEKHLLATKIQQCSSPR